MATHTTSFANLDTLLKSLPANTPETAYSIEITDLTTGNLGAGYRSGTLGYILRQNNTKYVDLSTTSLPSNITSLSSTFQDCATLVYTPPIPNTVIDLGATFAGCSSLRVAPAIPASMSGSSVSYAMDNTFLGCTSIKYIPLIPAGLTGISAETFTAATKYLYFEEIDFTNYASANFSKTYLPNLKCIYVPSAAAKTSFTNNVTLLPSGFDVNTQVQEMYTVADLTALDTLLQSLPDNTTDTPYYITITTLASGETTGKSSGSPTSGTLQYILQQNATKYVDLYIDTDIGQFNNNYMFTNCTSIVGIHLVNTTSLTSSNYYVFYNVPNLVKIDVSKIYTEFNTYFYNCNFKSVGNTQDYDVVIRINALSYTGRISNNSSLEIVHLKNEFTQWRVNATMNIASNPLLTTVILDNALYAPSYLDRNDLRDLPIIPNLLCIKFDMSYNSNLSCSITTQKLKTMYPNATHIAYLNFKNTKITEINIDFQDYIWYTTNGDTTEGNISAGMIGSFLIETEECTELTSCIMTNLNKICALSFKNCTKLERALFPDLVYICKYTINSSTGEPIIGSSDSAGLQEAFYGCTSLVEVDLSKVEYVLQGSSYNSGSKSAFYNCISLTDIDLSKLTYVKDNKYSKSGVNANTSYGMFANCTSLKTVKLNPNLYFNKEYGNYPDNKNCNCVGPYMFYNCTSLQSITGFPYRLRVLYNTFNSCSFTNLNDVVTLPNNSEATDFESTFENCTNLQSVSLPNTTIYSIQKMCKGCTKLVNVSLTNIEYIAYANNAFEGCTLLTNIALPKLKYIYSAIDMFNDCPNITANTEFIKYILFNSSYISNNDIKTDNDINVSVTALCAQSGSTIINNASVYSDLQPDSDNTYILPYNILSNNMGAISTNLYNNKTLIIQNLDNKAYDTKQTLYNDNTTKIIILDTDIDPYNIAKDLTYNAGSTFTSTKMDISNSSIYVKTNAQRNRWINILTTCAVFGDNPLTQEEAEQLVKLRKTSTFGNKLFSNLKIGNNKITTLYKDNMEPYWSKGDNGYGLNYTTTYDIGNIIFENRKMCTVYDYIQHKKEYESTNGSAIGGIIKIKNDIPIMIALYPNTRRSETQLNYTTGDRCGYAPADIRKFKMFKDNTVAAYNMSFNGDGHNFYAALCTTDPTGTATDTDLAENYPLVHAVRKFRNDKQYYNEDWYLPTDWGDLADQVNGYTIDYSENEETIKRFIATSIIFSMIFGFFPKSNSTSSTPPMEFIAQYRLNGTSNPYVAGRYITAIRPVSNYGDVTKASYFLPCVLLHRVGPEYDGSQQIGSLR